jgi:hypothetical protein
MTRRAGNIRWAYILLTAIAIVMVVGLSLASGLAFGFFFFPAVIGLICGYVFYRALVNGRVRNPMRPPRPTITEQWADGQPLGRATTHADERVRMSEDEHESEESALERDARITQDAARTAQRNDPRDYEGPPPVVPFP